MSDKIFRIDFYPKDWLLDTAQLAPDVRGIFIQIVCLIYAKGGPIDNDSKWIAGVSGCSSRLVSSSVDKLVDGGFLFINDSAKLAQKRAENELNMKRNFLEHSSKGGRTSAENRSESKKNNKLSSTEGMESVSTPTPPHPTPPPSSILKHPDSSREGVLKNRGGKAEAASPQGGGKFRIENKLSQAGIDAARAAAPGWDVYNLMRIYDEGVNNGKREKPGSPDDAFPAWCRKYTKGKKP